MEEQKKDVEEKDTPQDSSPKEKPEESKEKVEEPEDSKSQIDAEIEKAKQELENLKKAKEEELSEVSKLRAEKRTLVSTNDNYSEEEPGEETQKEALNIFCRFHPEYLPENDPANEKFKELEKHFRRLKSGVSVAEVVDTLEYIHENLIPKEKPNTDKEEVAPQGIGSTKSVPPKSEDSLERLAKSLQAKATQSEKELAAQYTKGKDAYWQYRAEQEQKRKQGISGNLL